jgi:predicted small metal-binding protein
MSSKLGPMGPQRRLRCADTGNETCEYVAFGESDDQIILDIGHHAEEVHGIKERPPDASERLRALIGED